MSVLGTYKKTYSYNETKDGETCHSGFNTYSMGKVVVPAKKILLNFTLGIFKELSTRFNKTNPLLMICSCVRVMSYIIPYIHSSITSLIYKIIACHLSCVS